MPGLTSPIFPKRAAHSTYRLQNRLMPLRSRTLRRTTAAMSAGKRAYSPDRAVLTFLRRSVIALHLLDNEGQGDGLDLG